MAIKKVLLVGIVTLIPFFSKGQINENQLGAWYMYFYTNTFGSGPWGIQGDVQLRQWDKGGDLEQLLVRSGVTYSPEQSNVLLTLGLANITSGTFGEETSTMWERRIYQEAMYPVKIGGRISLNHRFRFEQRFPEDQDFKTRYRYNLFVSVPITSDELTAKTIYLALYNEIFLNGQSGREDVELFDRNRFYAAMGYYFSSRIKTQVGIMTQTTNTWQKTQLQISFHQSF